MVAKLPSLDRLPEGFATATGRQSEPAYLGLYTYTRLFVKCGRTWPK